MSKSTPGPWRVRRASDGRPYQIETDEPVPVAITSWGGILRRASSEGEANARLIAAAPDMLEALRALLALPGMGYTRRIRGQNEKFCDVFDAAHAAIAKAEGRDDA